MLESVIKLENVGKQYRIGEERYHSLREDLVHLFRKKKKEYIWALRDVSFEVKKGEAMGIIGPNGAGKTTILKLLSGITMPTTGEIFVKGKVASLLEIGAGLHPELTGRENIFLYGSIMGMKIREINKRFDKIVGFAELGQFIDTPVKRYSAGMCVKLGFSISAHMNSDILLIDEVLAVGDINFQKKCKGFLDGFKKNGNTVIIVSHDLGSIISWCTKTIWLNRGILMTSGISREVINKYINYENDIDGKIKNIQMIRLISDPCWFNNYNSGKVVEEPRGIAVSKKGEILVASMKSHQLAVFSSEGKCLRSIGKRGIGPGMMYSPTGVAVNSKGEIYVSDIANGSVLKFSQDAKYLYDIDVDKKGKSIFQEPFGLAVGNQDELFVTDRKAHKVYKLSDNQEQIFSIGEKGDSTAKFNFPISVAIDSRGYLYISDFHNHRIQIFDSKGKFILTFGTYGESSESFNGPHNIFIHGRMLYVVDHLNRRIKKYSIHDIPQKSPVLECIIVLPGHLNPCGIAIDLEEALYVTFGNSCFVGKYCLNL